MKRPIRIRKLLPPALAGLFIAAMIAVPASANTNPYWIASRCEFNPGIGNGNGKTCTIQTTKEACEQYSYCWWRDTTAQNLISQQTADEFTNQLVAVYTSADFSVYEYLTPFAGNVVLIVTPKSYAIVGTGGGASEALYIKGKLDSRIVGKTLRDIFYPNAYYQSIWGSRVWARGTINVYANAQFEYEIERQFLVEAEFLERSQRAYGTFLPWGEDAFVGMGSGKESRAVPPQTYAEPAILVSANTDVYLDGHKISLIPTGYNGAGLMVYLPAEGILIAGDLGTYLPDYGSIVHPGTSVNDFIDSMTYISNMTPAPVTLLPLQGRPITDNATAVRETVLAWRAAMQYLRDQTIVKINEHIALEDIVQQVQLPPDMAESPYLNPVATSVGSIVRSVYDEYMGWFDGNPAHLETLSSAQEASRLVNMAGGPKEALANAKKAITDHTREGAQWALQVASAVRIVSPSADADAIYVQALKMLAYTTSSAYLRNYYLSIAQDVSP